MKLFKPFLLLLTLSMAGCSTVAIERGLTDAELLDGHAAFGESVLPARTADFLALDDDMRDFVARQTRDSKHARVRLDHLLAGMIDEGLLTLDYDEQATHSARETFHGRQGNCLSFSTLFVALAREAGLTAHFQRVDVPPTFTANGETIVVNNHINILVEEVREGTRYFRNRVVDFNTAEYDGNYKMWPVSDDHALALFHSNLGVEAMAGSDWRLAFAHFKRAAMIDPSIADVWVNLGVVYARLEAPSLAIASYHRALAIDERHETALVNLGRIHERLGETDRARHYRERVAYHLKRNPYYHQALAQNALQEGDFTLALERIARAIRIKPGEHQFHFTKALALYRLGEISAAELELSKAAELAAHPWVAERYANKLTALRD